MAKTVGPGPHRGDVRRNGARRRVAWAIFRQAFWSMRWIVAAAIAIMLVVSGINAVQPLLYRLLFDTAVPEADYGLIAAVVAGIVVAPIAAIGITYASQYLQTLIAYRVSAGLREAVLPHLLRARMGFLESRTPVDLMFRITRETGRIGERYVNEELLPFVQHAITLTLTVVLMVVVDARLAAAALIALPITYLITARLTGRSRVLDKLLRRHTVRGEQFLTETFRGIGTVRMLGGEAVHEAQWRGWLRRFLHLRTRSIPLHSMLLTFPTDVVSNVVIGGMLAYGAVRIIDGTLTLGAMIAFMAYVPRAYGALRGVLQTYVGTHTIRNSFERLDDLFAAPLEVDSPTAPGPELGGDIAFRDVTFSYGEGQALRGFTATFPAGHFIGLVGPSGGGKTTIFELMLRMREPDSGTITIGGTDIREASLASLRGHFAVVSQPIFLWNRSVAYNICYPLPVLGNEAAAVHASKRAGLHGVVQGLRRSYDTVLGEDGHTLSGGERQRVALARLFMRPAPVLLIDEGTGAIDSVTEQIVLRSLRELSRGRTTIVIAHRLATVMEADTVLVLDGEGRLSQEGPPRELIKREGFFRDLFETQRLTE
ncbi:MAG: ABC transporter ATP-binding protein [Spirochaetaceae bacterium]|nr:ABC transporter ATP-binding protein [Spirochaetaceae bacterium]